MELLYGWVHSETLFLYFLLTTFLYSDHYIYSVCDRRVVRTGPDGNPSNNGKGLLVYRRLMVSEKDLRAPSSRAAAVASSSLREREREAAAAAAAAAAAKRVSTS